MGVAPGTRVTGGVATTRETLFLGSTSTAMAGVLGGVATTRRSLSTCCTSYMPRWRGLGRSMPRWRSLGRTSSMPFRRSLGRPFWQALADPFGFGVSHDLFNAFPTSLQVGSPCGRMCGHRFQSFLALPFTRELSSVLTEHFLV